MSYFGIPRQSIRSIIDRLILFKQTLVDVESMYKDIGGSDMRYNEFKETCGKEWIEKYNYPCIDMARNKKEGNYRIFNASKNTYIECIRKSEAF